MIPALFYTSKTTTKSKQAMYAFKIALERCIIKNEKQTKYYCISSALQFWILTLKYLENFHQK